MNMIEKVAKALFEDYYSNPYMAYTAKILYGIEKPTWELINSKEYMPPETWLHQAKIAIEAMREPTEEMLACIDTTDDPGIAAIYTEMIDVALKETK